MEQIKQVRQFLEARHAGQKSDKQFTLAECADTIKNCAAEVVAMESTDKIPLLTLMLSVFGEKVLLFLQELQHAELCNCLLLKEKYEVNSDWCHPYLALSEILQWEGGRQRDPIMSMFRAIETYYNRQFSMIYDLRDNTDPCCALEHIVQNNDVESLMAALDAFSVSDEEFDRTAIDEF